MQTLIVFASTCCPGIWSKGQVISGKQVQIRVPLTPDQKMSEGGWLLVCNYRGQHFESYKNLQVELLSSAGMKRRLDLFGSKIRCQILLRI